MKNMEVWSFSHTSFFATSIHIDATSTQLSQTYNLHGFFDLLLLLSAKPIFIPIFTEIAA